MYVYHTERDCARVLWQWLTLDEMKWRELASLVIHASHLSTVWASRSHLLGLGNLHTFFNTQNTDPHNIVSNTLQPDGQKEPTKDSNAADGCSPREMHLEWDVVVEVRERNAVLSADRLANDDLVDVVELIPVFVSTQTKQWPPTVRCNWSLSFAEIKRRMRWIIYGGNWRRMCDDQDECEWVNVSSGTGPPGYSQTNGR